jgi:D-ribulokinase
LFYCVGVIMAERLFMGIDVGTQGSRVIIVTEKGRVLAEAAGDFEPGSGQLPSGWFQQSPRAWWAATRKAISQSLASLGKLGINPPEIYALSVTSTSGTILAVDQNGEPLGDAIMYNDSRAALEAEEINEVSLPLRGKLGYKFNASFGLPKMLWIKQNQPDIFRRTRLFIHAGDYILGKICGNFGITDYSNALKSGYDVESFHWPGFIEDSLDIPPEMLPKVLPSGEPVAGVSRQCSDETGLSGVTRVVLGMTDGCASQVASGAVRPGTWNTTIGTTLVIKGVTSRLISDSQGRIYSHRHPDGYWMPGGASNVGGGCLETHFKKDDFGRLNKGIAGFPPSNLIIYPLQKNEERFPIRKSGITGFMVGEAQDRYQLYQGYLEGVGYVERLAYDLLGELGAELGDKIYVAGGASKSMEWLKIRAAILNKLLCKPGVTGAQMGVAVLAASKTHYHSLAEAAEAMVKIEKKIVPEPEMAKLYAEKYQQFLVEMKRREYL